MQLDTTSSSLKFVPATENYFVLDTSGEPTGSELTRNVPVIYSGSTAPDGLAVAPGEDFSLGDCGIGETCSPVKGATLSNIVFTGNPAVIPVQGRRSPGLPLDPAGTGPYFQIQVVDYSKVKPVSLSIHIMEVLQRLYPDQKPLGDNSQEGAGSRIRMFDKVMGTDQVRLDLVAGKTADEIIASWQPEVVKFEAIRKKYLLYK